MTIIVDTGSSQQKERGKEKDRTKQILATFSFRPHQQESSKLEMISSPRLTQSTDDTPPIVPEKGIVEGKLPDEKIARWAQDVAIGAGGGDSDEEKRVTTVSMFIKGMNESRVKLGDGPTDSLIDLEKSVAEEREKNLKRTVRGADIMTTKPVPHLSRKRSKATRVSECLSGIKSRVGHTIHHHHHHLHHSPPSTEGNLTISHPMPQGITTPGTTKSEIPRPGPASPPPKRKMVNKSTSSESSTDTPPLPAQNLTTTASGAISNQPLRPSGRTGSIRAFLKYFEDGKQKIVAPRRTKSTPTATVTAPTTSLSSSKRPTTSPAPNSSSRSPKTPMSPQGRQRGHTVDGSGYISDSGKPRSGISPTPKSTPGTPGSKPARTGTGNSSITNSPIPEGSSRKIIQILPPIDVSPPPVSFYLLYVYHINSPYLSLQKPLPRLPYKFSTFPAPTPPRSPLIKAPIGPPNPNVLLQQLQSQALASSSKPQLAPGKSQKIVPFNELNRRLAREHHLGVNKQRKNSTSGPSATSERAGSSSALGGAVGGGIASWGSIRQYGHRRGRSVDSRTTPSVSSRSLSPSRPITAVTTAEVAINGLSFAMKGKLIGVGKNKYQQEPPLPRSTVPSKMRRDRTVNGGGRGVRRVASDDTIRQSRWMSSGRGLGIQTSTEEIKRPSTANAGLPLGLGIEMAPAGAGLETGSRSGGADVNTDTDGIETSSAASGRPIAMLDVEGGKTVAIGLIPENEKERGWR